MALRGVFRGARGSLLEGARTSTAVAGSVRRQPPPLPVPPAVEADALEAKVRAAVGRHRIIGHPVDGLTVELAAQLIVQRALIDRAGATVHCTNVDLAVTSTRCPDLRRAAENAFLTVPDGMPLVWIMRRRGVDTGRVAGTELMWAVAHQGAPFGLRHLLFGGSHGVAELAAARLERATGNHVDVYIPPWSSTADWDLSLLHQRLRQSRPHVMWVCLGAPKQELWMARVAGALPVPVMVGVGAAFDFIAGHKRRAPHLLQRAGLEWLFRLATEPRRLWKRYLLGNSEFVARLAVEAVRRRRAQIRPSIYR